MIAAKDLLSRFRNLSAGGNLDSAWGILRALILQQFTIPDLQKLNHTLLQQAEQWREFTSGRIRKVAIIGGYTTQPIRELVLPILLSEGYWTEIYEGNYNSVETEPLDPNAPLYAFGPDILIVATGTKHINSFPRCGMDLAFVQSLAASEVERLKIRWDAIVDRTAATIIQHNFEPASTLPLGRNEGRYHWSKTNFVHLLNSLLWKYEGASIRVLDIHQLAGESGRLNWHSPRWNYHSKHGFDPGVVSQYGRALAGILRGILGKTRKCLAVDLDNTLWGGVIGDDGLEGIALGNVSPEGEAFAAFGTYLKELRNQGVILAVNSKNNRQIAEEVFRRHSQCPLRLDDFSAFVCSWDNKSTNLKLIAESLNIGEESIVFADDNPAECEQVMLAQPAVNVVELSGDPSSFPDQIDRLHLFAPLDLTAEDFARQESYVANQELARIVTSPETLSAYLEGLEMRAIIRPATSGEIPRIDQLFRKTNQFNLTGQVFSRESLQEILSAPDVLLLVAQLEDRLANHGLVSALVARSAKSTLSIENWVMSCRVFSRTLEEAIFLSILDFACAFDCTEIRGTFIRTKKNDYVSDLFARLGFKSYNGEHIYRLTAEKPTINTMVQRLTNTP
jgi:FkbH-like protein